MFCGDLDEKKIQNRGDICILRADSLCCTAETNTTLFKVALDDEGTAEGWLFWDDGQSIGEYSYSSNSFM